MIEVIYNYLYYIFKIFVILLKFKIEIEIFIKILLNWAIKNNNN